MKKIFTLSGNDLPTNTTGTPFTTPVHLSDKAFYLIVLACLIKESITPDAFQQLLMPGKHIGYGDINRLEEA